MSEYKRKTITILIFLIAGAHLSLQFLKILPTNPLSNYYRPIINKLDTGFFPQRWLLFAPEPPTFSHRFHYRCEKGHSWSSWQDPVESYLKNHHKNRIHPDQYMVRYLKESIRVVNNKQSNIGKELGCPKKEPKCFIQTYHKLRTSREFKAIKKYISSKCQDAQSFQLRSLTISPIPFSKRNKIEATASFNINVYPIEKI